MASSNLALLGLALVLLAMAPGALSHAGHMHNGADPMTQNYLPLIPIATCGSWSTKNASLAYQLTGTSGVYAYNYKNCTDQQSTAFIINGTLTKAGAPARNVSLGGNTYVGTCASPGAVYYQNATLGDDDTNMLWFHEFYSNATNGRVFGTAANSLLIRTNTTSEGPAAKTFIISTETEGPILCCSLTFNTAVNTSAASISNALNNGPNGINTCLSNAGTLAPGASPTLAPRPPPPPSGATAAHLSVMSLIAGLSLFVLLL